MISCDLGSKCSKNLQLKPKSKMAGNVPKIIGVDNPRSNEYIVIEREWRNWQTHWT
jgi:hypothetical protein